MLDTIKSTTRHVIEKCIFYPATIISPVLNTQLRYFQANKRFANLKNPQTLTEKLSWLKLNYYNNDQLVIKCADKFRVREYVKECGFEDNLIPIIATYSSPKEICWEKLPNQFVIKWNFGSGYNILCKDKRYFNVSLAVKKLKKWQKNNYHLRYAELQYKNISSKVLICEKYLDMPENEDLLDYKLYCFHGKVMAILVIARPEDNDTAAVFLSPEWEILSTDVHEKYKKTISPNKPNGLFEMISIAETLSQPFPFVRVDFYYHENKVLFGEMTFTPAGGLWTSETKIDGKDMGTLLNIENIVGEKNGIIKKSSNRR